MIHKVTYLWQGHCRPSVAKTMAPISIRFDPWVTLSNVAPELGWYPTKGRSNAVDKLYLINLICIDSLGLYAKARYLFEPRAVFFSLATDEAKKKKKEQKSERNKTIFQLQERLMRQAKFNPAAWWWCGRGCGVRLWYLSLSSQWHRQGKVSGKVSGCRMEVVGNWENVLWQLVREKKAESKNETSEKRLVKKHEMRQETEIATLAVCPERLPYHSQPQWDVSKELTILACVNKVWCAFLGWRISGHRSSTRKIINSLEHIFKTYKIIPTFYRNQGKKNTYLTALVPCSVLESNKKRRVLHVFALQVTPRLHHLPRTSLSGVVQATARTFQEAAGAWAYLSAQWSR